MSLPIAVNTKDQLLGLGMINAVLSGIQVDINAAFKKITIDGSSELSYKEASHCDHNCTKVNGGYDCDAAISLNKGIIGHLAPSHVILQRINHARQGILLARDEFLNNGFVQYCNEFKIPSEVAGALRESLENDVVEVNLFGGNPEMHKELAILIAALKASSFRVTVTTTGRRLMLSKEFVEDLNLCTPHVIAMSADDCNLEQLRTLVSLTSEQLKGVWSKIPKDHGQEQKFVEALYAAEVFAHAATPPRILFNMVIHQGNIDTIRAIMDTLRERFRHVTMNPYPAQSSFQHKAPIFEPRSLPSLELLIDENIDHTIAKDGNVVPRLHYWLLLKAIFETYQGNSEKIVQALAGYDTWQCYRNPGNMYVQIGRAPTDKVFAKPTAEPGGYLGCFWNADTVTHEHSLTSDAQAARYLVEGVGRLSKQAKDPCPGCLMPRLMFGMITTEQGMNPELVEQYLRLRKQCAGF